MSFNPRTSCEVRLHLRQFFCMCRCFNPRTSCEVRPSQCRKVVHFFMFQSTHLLRGATTEQNFDALTGQVSIHAPLARCDRRTTRVDRYVFRFNPRTSCEVRHPIFLINRLERFVSIHAPLARCDCNHLGCYRHSHRFNPRTSCEVRQQKDIFIVSFACIDGDIFPLIQFVLTKLGI